MALRQWIGVTLCLGAGTLGALGLPSLAAGASSPASPAQMRAVGVQAAAHPLARRRGGAHTAIVGGTAATPGTFPSLAFVLLDEGNGLVQICTGTVVAPNVVMTAAHCVVDPMSGVLNPAAKYAVVTGTVDWTNPTTRQVSA